MPNPNPHVVVFTFPFGSQPIPLLNLVLRLSLAAPHAVFSFFNTASSNRHLNLSSKHLPPNVKTHTLDDVLDVDTYLEAASVNFRSAVAAAAAAEGGRRVTCLLVDAIVSSWAQALAQHLHVPWFPVWFPLPAALLSHIYTNSIRDTVSVSDKDSLTIPSLSVFKVTDLPEVVLLERDSLFSQTLTELERVLSQAKALVVCFFKELNHPSQTKDLDSKFGNVLYVGNVAKSATSQQDPSGCLAWLDGKKPKSVVYISFGTAVALSPEEIGEFAEALEESKVTFLWSVRESELPRGFVERTGRVGKIVGWAPQVKVLGHRAVGVFVTQGGCNSVTESIAAGVAVICRPIFADQRMVGRMVEEVWGIGRRMEGKGGLVRSMEAVMGDDHDKVEQTRELLVKACGPNGSATVDTKSLVEIMFH